MSPCSSAIKGLLVFSNVNIPAFVCVCKKKSFYNCIVRAFFFFHPTIFINENRAPYHKSDRFTCARRSANDPLGTKIKKFANSLTKRTTNETSCEEDIFNELFIDFNEWFSLSLSLALSEPVFQVLKL